MATNNILKFGEQHLETVLVLDAMAGGSGFYGHPATRELADSYALGEQDLKRRSPMYNDPRTVEIREKAEKNEDTLGLRKKFAEEVDSTGYVTDLMQTAGKIQNPYCQDVRLDQARSLLVVNDVLLADLGLKPNDMQYVDALIRITGITPPMMPEKEFMERYVSELLRKMGKPADAPLGEAAYEWRKQVGLLSKEEMGDVYRRASMLMLDILHDNGIRSEADLKVEILEKAPWMGFFAYGDREGNFHGETCMVKSDTKCAFDVIETATHEIGGHYNVGSRWHDYALRTGDIFPAVGVMACNQTALNEGYATTAAGLFEEDLGHIFNNIGFGLNDMSEDDLRKNLSISTGLETLAMMALGYEAARFFHHKDIDAKGMEADHISFGVDPHRAKSRAEHMCEAPGRLHPYCYYGPGYYPGMTVVREFLEKFGKAATLKDLTRSGPPSLSAMKRGLAYLRSDR